MNHGRPSEFGSIIEQNKLPRALGGKTLGVKYLSVKQWHVYLEIEEPREHEAYAGHAIHASSSLHQLANGPPSPGVAANPPL